MNFRFGFTKVLGLAFILNSLAMPVAMADKKKDLEKGVARMGEIYGDKVRDTLKQVSDTNKPVLITVGLALNDRIAAKKDVNKSDAKEFILAATEFSAKSGQNLLGSGCKDCVSNFAPEAVNNAMALVTATKGSVTADAAFKAMVIKDREIFPTDDEKQAQDRICALADASCAVFGDAIRGVCQKLKAEEKAKTGKLDEDKKGAKNSDSSASQAVVGAPSVDAGSLVPAASVH